MDNTINTTTAEGRTSVAKEVRNLFVSNMKALGHETVALGADVMPRAIWANAIALAMAERGIISAEQADAVAVVLNSDLGNSSQLGAKLEKDGVLKRQSATAAATSLSAMLAARAAAAVKPA